MYPKYFGLTEPSFSIAPDPQYLFLSEQHQEALAHLLYGASESGGFVLLTGEVGTGKTMVCRAFLEQLPEGVDVALILNPAQSANELLTNVCDEFRIPLPKGKLSNKMLIDRLNAYLLAAHANGRRPLLIIDEAQNLLPQAMEQIRLLTNLETTKHKLLQIFLVGQPELRRMLERDRLRQLNQRITARFHLTPFSLKETGDYIRHRIAVAGVDRPLFAARAIRHIYRLSGGIPRLINILCDRALLGTCVTRGSQVTPAIVAKAAQEVSGDPFEVKGRSPLQLLIIALASFGLAGALALAAHVGFGFDPVKLLAQVVQQDGVEPPVQTLPEQAEMTESTTPEPERPPAEAGVDSAEPEPEAQSASEPAVVDAGGEDVAMVKAPIEASLDRLAMSRPEAMGALLRRWGLDQKTLGTGDPCIRILNFGLSCEQEQGRLSHVRFFDLPVLLKVLDPDGAPAYVALGALDATEATLDLPEGSERVALEDLERIWTGDYTLIWQLPPGGSALIGSGSSGEDVRWLREVLSKIPDLSVLPSQSAYFDAALANALRAFQASKGLLPDGIVGPRTFIALQQAAALPGIPRLTQSSSEVESLEDAP